MPITYVQRYPELDLLRSLAIVMMVIYHLLFDLSHFYGYDIDVLHGTWKLFARATATLFLLLVGIGFAISSHARFSWGRQFRRFLTIGAAALLVTAVTYVIDPETYVRFGILHLIATSSLLLPLFRSQPAVNVCTGILIVAAGATQTGFPVETPVLIPLGWTPSAFRTLDWFPLIPWFGVILIGTGLGHIWYVRTTSWRAVLPSWIVRTGIVGWPGRHSLLLYLTHQPVLLALLYLLLGPWR